MILLTKRGVNSAWFVASNICHGLLVNSSRVMHVSIGWAERFRLNTGASRENLFRRGRTEGESRVCEFVTWTDTSRGLWRHFTQDQGAAPEMVRVCVWWNCSSVLGSSPHGISLLGSSKVNSSVTQIEHGPRHEVPRTFYVKQRLRNEPRTAV